MKDLVGTEVDIYTRKSPEMKFSGQDLEPNKRGIIRDVYDQGVMFEITSYDGTDGQYIVGSWSVIPFSNLLSVKPYKP